MRSVIGSCVDWGARWACELKLPQYSNMLNITTCPTCGSKNIKRVRKAWKGTALGQGYIVPNLIYHQCGDRGEQVFDREAMRRIEAATPLGVELRLLKHLM